VADDEPKPLVFPPNPAGGDQEPRPLDFSKMTSDWIKPERPAMSEPKGLNFGAVTPPAPKPAQVEPRGLTLPPITPTFVEVHEMGRGLVGHVRVDPSPEELLARLRPQRPPAAPREAIIGGDPRAPALVEKAKTLDAAVASHILFRSRLEAFLDLQPMAWMTWGDESVQPIVKAAEQVAKIGVNIQTANAPKWADETRAAYQKGKTGLFDKKPEFYAGMLENAQDILTSTAVLADTQKAVLREKLDHIKVDSLVLQVSTADLTDAMQMQIASSRLRVMITSLQNAASLLVTLEQSALMAAKQAGDVSQLLTGLLPQWITARTKA
jgi:hypothetical protein